MGKYTADDLAEFRQDALASEPDGLNLYEACDALIDLLRDALFLGLSVDAEPGDRQPCEKIAAEVEAMIEQLRTKRPGQKYSPWRALQLAIDEKRRAARKS